MIKDSFKLYLLWMLWLVSKCVKWRGTHDVTPYECLWSSGSGSGCCVETVWVSLETWEREERRREQLSGSHQESVVIMSTMNDVHQFRSKTPSFLISAEPPAQVWSLVKYLWPWHVILDYISFKFNNRVHIHISLQVWHTSVLNKLDQVVATSYSRNHAEVKIIISFYLIW